MPSPLAAPTSFAAIAFGFDLRFFGLLSCFIPQQLEATHNCLVARVCALGIWPLWPVHTTTRDPRQSPSTMYSSTQPREQPEHAGGSNLRDQHVENVVDNLFFHPRVRNRARRK